MGTSRCEPTRCSTGELDGTVTDNRATDDDRPTLRVIRGDASPEEIAALLAEVSARAAAPAAE
jgi:hypothetical protein